MQRQALIAEKENQKLRDQKNDLESDVAHLRTENEALKAQVSEMGGESKSLELRIDEEVSKQRMRMEQQIMAFQSQHDSELEEKDKRIAELQNEMALKERQHDERIYRLQNELDEYKQQVGQLKHSEAVIEVYKKKLEQMADLRTELVDAQELNQKLY